MSIHIYRHPHPHEAAGDVFPTGESPLTASRYDIRPCHGDSLIEVVPRLMLGTEPSRGAAASSFAPGASQTPRGPLPVPLPHARACLAPQEPLYSAGLVIG